MSQGINAGAQDIVDRPVSARSGLARLLQPRSVAIAGASPDLATMGGTILANCDRFGFDGDIHLISPTRDEIGGRPCIRSVDDLPEGVAGADLLWEETMRWC